VEVPPSSLRRRTGRSRAPSTRSNALRSPAGILIVAHARLHRDALTGSLLSRGLNPVNACPPDQAVARAFQGQPQVALLDLGLELGFTLAAQLLAGAPRVKSILLGVSGEQSDLVLWAETGLAAYVSTEESLDDLVAAIVSVMDSDASRSPRVSAAFVSRVQAFASVGATASLAELTARETEVADLLAFGLSNKEIALCLSIALPTVKAHVHNILGKLNARRRGEAAARIRARQSAGLRPALQDQREGRSSG
jgi:two-component system, NarL family, nitrate/nitrite response regulator NarL